MYQPPPLPYGQFYYHNNNHLNGVGKYHPQQQLVLQKLHHRGRDSRPTAPRRNARSQQQHDGGNAVHRYAPAQYHPHQRPPSDGDHVVGMKYDVQAAGKPPVPPFRPSQPVWASQYPVPWLYYVKTSIVQPSSSWPAAAAAPQHAQHGGNHHGRKSRYVQPTAGGAAVNRIGGGGSGQSPVKPPTAKVVYIEYGGFKPKMVPSVQISGADDFDDNNNNNRRQSTLSDDDNAVTVVTRSADGTDGTATVVDGEHRDNAVTDTAAATATTTTATATGSATTTNSTTSTEQQQPELNGQRAAGVVVVVV